MVAQMHEARLKIERAKNHIANLDVERIKTVGVDAHLMVPYFDAESDFTRYVLENIPAISPDIPLILGDAIHNLRTALDYVACQIVRDAGNPIKGIYFPIAETPERYESESPGKTHGMPIVAKGDIDRLRPYKGGNNLLWGLHMLDIIDKHRLLVVTTMRVGQLQMTLSREPTEHRFAIPAFLEAGDVLLLIKGNHVADKQTRILIDIAFGEPDVLAGRPIMETLNEMAQYIERVVAHFERR
jgi:hypothetical protein